MLLDHLIVLLACQLAGEVIVVSADLPVPGPVIGMVLLFAGLAIRGAVSEGLARTAGGLLDHLALLFVPAGVGVLQHLPLLQAEYPAIAAALIGSTVLTIAATGLLIRWIARTQGGGDDT